MPSSPGRGAWWRSEGCGPGRRRRCSGLGSVIDSHVKLASHPVGEINVRTGGRIQAEGVKVSSQSL